MKKKWLEIINKIFGNDEIEQKDLIYNHALIYYRKPPQVQKAEALLAKMQSDGFVLNEYAIDIMTQIYLNAGMRERADQFVTGRSTTGQPRGDSPSVKTYTILLRDAIKAKDESKIESIISSMKNEQIEPDRYFLEYLMNFYIETNQIVKAEEVF